MKNVLKWQKKKAVRIILSFSITYLYDTGFSSYASNASTKTKYHNKPDAEADIYI